MGLSRGSPSGLKTIRSAVVSNSVFESSLGVFTPLAVAVAMTGAKITTKSRRVTFRFKLSPPFLISLAESSTRMRKRKESLLLAQKWNMDESESKSKHEQMGTRK